MVVTIIDIFRVYLPILLLGISLLLVVRATGVWLRTSAARRWPSTSGTVVDSRIIESEDDGDLYYHPEVQFRYQVNGKVYPSDQWAIGSRVVWGGQRRDPKKAQSVVERYPAGRAVQVYYNPRQPEQATLEVRSVNTLPLIGVAFLLTLVGGGLALGMNALSSL
jgi:hypothetical protein